MAEANERALDTRVGSHGYHKYDDGRGRGGYSDRHGDGWRGDGHRERRPWVERSDRYGQSGGNHGGRPWFNRGDRRDDRHGGRGGGGRGHDRGHDRGHGGGGRGGGGGYGQRVEGHSRRF